MALSPDDKKIYINKDTTAGEADEAMYLPVKYLTGLESISDNTVTLYFRGPNNTTSTSITVVITTGYIKEFYTQFVNEINFGDKAVITLAVKNLSVSTTQGGSDFVYVNATVGAAIANDDSSNFEDLQIAEDLDVGGNLDVVGTITGDLTGDVTGNADSATLAVSTSALVVADESTDTTCFPVFVNAATGVTLAAKSGSNLTFNSNSGLLTATLLAGNLTGDVTGNADTATALATARAINGVDFDGSAPITVTAAGSTLSDTVTVAKGGTGATSLTTDGVLFGNGTSAISAVDLSSNGNIVVGGSTPAAVTGANLAGSGLAATVGNGTLVLAVETLVNVASEAQAPIGMQIARRTITTAEANAMNSTPIEVVPAQGADTIIVPVNCLTRVDRAANQTNSACDMNAHYADKEPGTYLTASLLHWRRFMYGETTDHSEMRTPVESTSGVTLTESVNKGIELSFDSAATTNCFTSIDIFMTYYIIDIS